MNSLGAVHRAVVFGGTGFLGRRVASALVTRGMTVGVAARRPSLPDGTLSGCLRPIIADVTDITSVAHAVDTQEAVVNCVSLYVESGEATFQAIHVRGAHNVATAARKAGAKALVHISGIGSDRNSASNYVRARAEGEAAVRDAFPSATILRPSVMFGCGDTFLSALANVAAVTPVIPLFGRGDTKLQPVFVDDVAKAVAESITMPDARSAVFELGGPDILPYRTIVQNVLAWTDRSRLLLPFPFFGWRLLAAATNFLRSPPVTEAQVALLEKDNVVGQQALTFADLGLAPKSMADIAPSYLAPI